MLTTKRTLFSSKQYNHHWYGILSCAWNKAFLLYFQPWLKIGEKKKNLAWLVHKMIVTISPLYISLKWDLYFLWPYFKANSIYFFDYLTINPVFCWDIKQISQFNNEYLALRHTWPFLWTRWLNHENHLNRYN